jgi:N4-gp56 family major capsid protein
MAINLATKYSNKIDEVVNATSLTNSAVNNDYDFVSAQTVKVYSFGVAPMNDYQASGSNRYGTPSELEDSVQEMTMGQKKSFTFTIDKTNAIDSPEGVRDAGKALKRQIDGAVVPMVDTYRLVTMATNAGYTDVTAITKSNAYEKFLDANASISENEMPIDGRIAYVSPDYYKLLKQDANFIKASDLAQDMLIKGQVGSVDGVAIISVPSTRLAAGVSFVITHPMACTSPINLADYEIHEDAPGVAGHLIEGLVYYDAFILNNKKNAIATQFGKLGTLTASMEASTSGKGLLTITGNTNGGKLVYKTGASQAAATLGADVSNWTEVPANGEITATATHKVAVALDIDGKAVAASAAITVDVGA